MASIPVVPAFEAIPDGEILISQVETEHLNLLSGTLRQYVDTLVNIETSSDSGQSLLDYHKRNGFQEAYKMTSSPRGRCLIINNRDFTDNRLQERSGTDVDRDKLKELFNDLKYEVTVLNNCTADEIVSECQMFILGDFEGFDSCVLCILSHGRGGGKIYGSDCKQVNENKILDLFNSPQCMLNGKPKLVIIQACRITMKRSLLDDFLKKYCPKWNVVDTHLDGSPKQEVKEIIQDLRKLVLEDEKDKLNFQTAAPTDYSDILVAHSTQPDRLSYRNVENGSWFIYAIVKVFENQYKTEHVADMMKVARRVVREASGGIQTPQILDKLEKKFYFFPTN